MKKITIIIPFLNENIEIRNTLESIRQYAHDRVDILLINDHSDDDFNYMDTAKQYQAKYIKNEKRLGVAASRDLGVDMCQTPYFLLLDGHMRFYQEGWEKIIADELDKDDRVILCCQTKVLAIKDGIVYEKTSEKSHVSGAYINFDENRKTLEATWRYAKTETDNPIEPIPCILGAAYAGSKRYWKHLKGLYGLLSYGYDEAYLSLKVWLEGGRCLLLKHIIVGHIYRKSMPYTVEPAHLIYNQLLITELLLQGHQKARILYLLKQKHAFNQVYTLFTEKQREWKKLKNYYDRIFTRDFKEVRQMQTDINVDTQQEKELLLKRIATHLILQSSSWDDMGLLTGKMGITLFFFHYARYCGEKKYEEFGGELLDEIYQDIYEGMPITFNKGLCGIGWGIEYLVQNGFVEGNTDDILSEVDQKIMIINPLYINDFSFQTGIGGIFQYVNSRLISPRDKKSNLPFTPSYLEHLAEQAYRILNNAKADNICRDSAFRYLTIYQHTASKPEMPGIYEIISPWVPSGNDLPQWPLGLENGCAGKALKIILA